MNFLYFCVFILDIKHIQLTCNEMCFVNKIDIAIPIDSLVGT